MLLSTSLTQQDQELINHEARSLIPLCTWQQADLD